MNEGISHRGIAGVSHWIKEILLDLGWTRQRLYAKANINPERANDFYVIGEAPNPYHVEIIAKVTGYNKNWIWYGVGNRINTTMESRGVKQKS